MNRLPRNGLPVAVTIQNRITLSSTMLIFEEGPEQEFSVPERIEKFVSAVAGFSDHFRVKIRPVGVMVPGIIPPSPDWYRRAAEEQETRVRKIVEGVAQ